MSESILFVKKEKKFILSRGIFHEGWSLRDHNCNQFTHSDVVKVLTLGKRNIYKPRFVIMDIRSIDGEIIHSSQQSCLRDFHDLCSLAFGDLKAKKGDIGLIPEVKAILEASGTEL